MEKHCKYFMKMIFLKIYLAIFEKNDIIIVS